MASGQTHIILAQQTLNDLEHNSAKNYLNHNVSFVYIGAVGPDLPYLSVLDTNFLEKEEFLADYFHYNHTNELVNLALDRIKESNEDMEIKAAKFAFIMGFASHIINDGIVHAFVRDKVGDYQNNSTDHRVLELGLDVILIKELFGFDLNATDYHHVIGIYEDEDHTDEVLTFFSELIHLVYGQLPEMVKHKDQVTPKKIRGWIKGLILSLEVAESDKYPDFYRKIAAKKGVAYSNIEDIVGNMDDYLILKKPKDAQEHGLSDNFLGKNANVNFLEDVYPRCLEKVKEFWEDSFEYVFEGAEKPDFPAINLDNGRLLSNDVLTETPYYWR